MEEYKVIGLTGQTGAGKSTVCQIMASQGVDILDADKVAREVVDEQMQCLADLALEFSIEILNSDGSLNRRKLGDIVFRDKAKLRRLNDIIFPYILANIREKLEQLWREGAQIVVLDAPTLFESGANQFCDLIVSVVAPENQRLNRIVIRDRITDDQARARIASQHSENYYVSRSQYVIENTGDEADLRLRTLEVLGAIRRGEQPQPPVQQTAEKGEPSQ